MDVDKLVADEQHNMTLATAKIARMIQEGLNDAVTLPAVRTEATVAAHIMLGCDVWMALYIQACGLANVKNQTEVPEAVDMMISTVITDQVVHYAAHIVMHRGPLGECYCEVGE